MRVAFVAMRTHHQRDGPGARRLHRVARRLADRGHDVRVFCAQWWDGYREEIERDGITYRGVTVSPTEPSFTTRLPTMVAAADPDVVHASPTPSGQVLAANTGATLARTPLVVEWYGDRTPSSGRGRRLVARAADTLIVPSRFVQAGVLEAGASDDSVRIVPESIDMSLVREAPVAGGVDIVTARHLDASANVGSLLLALAELRDREWSATVIGDGPERFEYEKQAADLRIDDRVTFTGELPVAERLSLYKGAHVFVQTATLEYFATELLWALACGCVGIVEYQANSSAHELVERHERGFRVTSAQEVADAVVEAGDLETRTLDESLGTYDRDAVLDLYLTIYDGLLQTGEAMI